MSRNELFKESLEPAYSKKECSMCSACGRHFGAAAGCFYGAGSDRSAALSGRIFKCILSAGAVAVVCCGFGGDVCVPVFPGASPGMAKGQYCAAAACIIGPSDHQKDGAHFAGIPGKCRASGTSWPAAGCAGKALCKRTVCDYGNCGRGDTDSGSAVFACGKGTLLSGGDPGAFGVDGDRFQNNRPEQGEAVSCQTGDWKAGRLFVGHFV